MRERNSVSDCVSFDCYLLSRRKSSVKRLNDALLNLKIYINTVLTVNKSIMRNFQTFNRNRVLCVLTKGNLTRQF